MKSRSLYFDVGSWQGGEKRKPTMTFGLIEHNAIALCSYFSDGRSPFQIPSKAGNQEYNYQISHINNFLTFMMNNKYGKPHRFYQYETTPKEYHICWLIPFKSKSLLEDEDALIILIPDLHLHFFKGAFLDNFTTYYKSSWNGDRPGDTFTGERRSMEKEFGTLLKSIIDYQKQLEYDMRVITLGDTYEMWECQIIFDYFCIKKMTIKEVYKDLQSKIKELKDAFGKVPKIGNVLEQVSRIKIDERNIDQEFTKQIDVLKHIDVEKEYYIKKSDSKKEIWTKASNLESAILKKHKDKDGTTFNDLFRKIAHWERLHGNHDNYFVLENLNPILGIGNGQDREEEAQIEPYIQARQSKIFIHHGHIFDDANNDQFCELGYWLAGINALFEAKRYGDYFKNFEDVFRSGSEVREDLIQRSCKVFQYWGKSSKSDFKSKKNPESEFNIIIQGHTHKPYLKEITDRCRL